MEERAFARIRDWVEPAHPAAIKQFEELVDIYRSLREKLQDRIDETFDRISQEIGFVVTTTLPVILEARPKGETEWSVAGALKGTIFERAVLETLREAKLDLRGASGHYKLYLVWFDALKLKLRRDWLEPVHYLRADVYERLTEFVRVRPEVQEPAHWFNPGMIIPAEDQILIAAIDEVYPELRLSERVAMTRQLLRKISPEVMEPAHFHPGGAMRGDVLAEIVSLIRRVRPEVMEPAHFRPAERDILAEIAGVLRRYGA